MTTSAQKPTKFPGTRPEGVGDEREAAARVREMFSRIAPRYDLLNHLLSFSLDRLWRRRTARRFQHILRRTDARVLDLCCGTGDLAFALEHVQAALTTNPSGGRFPIIGSDFAQPMLERACAKARDGGHAVAFVTADVLNLPFSDGHFDLVTAAFGFRNLANYEKGLREIARVLKRGGKVGILDFSEPDRGLMAGLFRFYFRRILPRIGRVVSGNSDAYSYLPRSVAKFPSPSELVVLMEKVGFTGVTIDSWNFGSVILHSARRL